MCSIAVVQGLSRQIQDYSGFEFKAPNTNSEIGTTLSRPRARQPSTDSVKINATTEIQIEIATDTYPELGSQQFRGAYLAYLLFR